jgi:eukaryotic-like serine/threonine-protein kinase
VAQDDQGKAALPGEEGGGGTERTVTTGKPLQMPSPVLLASGAVLGGRYQIEAPIGHGGSGTVFRAWDRVLGEPIAIKILLGERARERSWIKRLAREVKVARAIRHPNVCRVFELGHSDGHWYITMELATGGALRQLLRDSDGKLRPLVERLDDARAVCAGLAAIHALGIIHRDVTPHNVLRMADGRLVLSDFGLAIELTANTTVHGGTPSYMPPETAQGQRASQRSDVWQLGAVLHEVMFGRRPEWEHDGDRTTMTWPASSSSGAVEEELARLCRDCLAGNPVLRPATAMIVAGRLAAAEQARPRSRVQRVWLQVSRAARRHRRAIGALGVALLLAGTARAIQLAARPPHCLGGSDKLAGLWDNPIRDTVRAAFERTGKSYAQSTFGTVDRALGRYLSAWAGMYTEACEATHVRGEQSADVLDLRMACLGDRLGGVRALAGLLQRADGAVVDNAVNAAGQLGTLEKCADARLLRAVLPPPDSGETRAEVEGLRRGLAEAKALHDAGGERRAVDRLRRLVVDARRVGYGPTLAEALSLLGQVEIAVGHNDAAHEALKSAFWQAEASRYDEMKAEVAVFLVLTSSRRGRDEETEDWIKQAEASLGRIGGHDRLRAWLALHLGEVRGAQGRNEEAIAHNWRAVELNERSGASRGQIARNMNNIAITLDEMGRTDEAIGYEDRAIADLSEELGPEHPLVGTFISNRGEMLARLRRHPEARAAFERALAIEEPGFGKDSTNLAYALAGLGESFLAENQPGAAIVPLERALAIRQAGETDRTLVADTSFSLARALWDARVDRARARRLASVAQKTYADKPFLRPRIERIGRWLEERQ